MQKYNKHSLFAPFVFLADIGIATLSCIAAEGIISTLGFFLSLRRETAVLFVIFHMLIFMAYDAYSERIFKASDIVKNVSITAFLSVIAVILCTAFLYFKTEPLSLYFLMFFIDSAVFVAAKLLHSKLLIRINGNQRILILDSVYSKSRLARKIKYSCGKGYTARYILIDEGLEEDIKYAEKEIDKYDGIFISSTVENRAALMLFGNAVFKNKIIYSIPTVDHAGFIGGKIIQFGDTPALRMKMIGMTGLQLFVKRVMDIVISVAGIVIFSPIMLVSAVAVKLDSPGPIIYKQERYTVNKNKFYIYKFRTMFADAEKYGARLASEKDDRITRVGKILRKLRVDEVPQLFNVLFGSMSVVGPRPERPIFADQYEKEVAFYDVRFFVKAGLTGYAQVYGKYNTRVSDKILMDAIYITQYSLFLDIKLILLTVKVLFTKESTEGVDEELDEALNADEKEYQRIIASKNDESLGNSKDYSEQIK